MDKRPDILIGAADNFAWKDCRNWVKSALASGFAGEIWIITYRVDADVAIEAAKLGVNVYPVEHDPYLNPIVHAAKGSPTQAHNLRFYHAWELLARLGWSKYRCVIMTDLRDVVFQKNPSRYLDVFYNDEYVHDFVVAGSEGLKFKDEPWNRQNLMNSYGQNYYDLNKCGEWEAANVGTIAGTAEFMQNIFHTLYSMTEGRSYPSDQSSFNVLIHKVLGYDASPMHYGWACQAGTTLDPTKSYLWPNVDPLQIPIIKDGYSYVQESQYRNEQTHFILHQYDRVPGLKEIIDARYA